MLRMKFSVFLFAFSALFIGNAQMLKNVLQCTNGNVYNTLSPSYLSECNKAHNISANAAISEIHLERNSIHRLERHLFNAYPNLTHLYLTHNKLQFFKVQLLQVQLLHLANNTFREFSDEFFQNMPKLRELFLAHNQLQKINWTLDIDVTIGQSAQLIDVDLSYNEHLEDVRISSETLKHLNLMHTDVRRLELRVPALRKLDLRHTRFRHEANLSRLCESSDNDLRITYTHAVDTMDVKIKHYTCAKSAKIRVQTVQAQTEQEQEQEQEQELEDQDVDLEERVLTGCEFTTLRRKPSDVVFTSREFFQLILLFYAAVAVNLVLIILLFVCLFIS